MPNFLKIRVLIKPKIILGYFSTKQIDTFGVDPGKSMTLVPGNTTLLAYNKSNLLLKVRQYTVLCARNEVRVYTVG
jgi:hypothetical protein